MFLLFFVLVLSFLSFLFSAKIQQDLITGSNLGTSRLPPDTDATFQDPLRNQRFAVLRLAILHVFFPSNASGLSPGRSTRPVACCIEPVNNQLMHTNGRHWLGATKVNWYGTYAWRSFMVCTRRVYSNSPRKSSAALAQLQSRKV